MCLNNVALNIAVVGLIKKNQIRVREEINLHFQESRRPHGKARGGRIAGYLTDEQRSQAGWIGALKCEVIFEQALSTGSTHIPYWSKPYSLRPGEPVHRNPDSK